MNVTYANVKCLLLTNKKYLLNSQHFAFIFPDELLAIFVKIKGSRRLNDILCVIDANNLSCCDRIGVGCELRSSKCSVAVLMFNEITCNFTNVECVI